MINFLLNGIKILLGALALGFLFLFGKVKNEKIPDLSDDINRASDAFKLSLLRKGKN